MKVTTKGLTEKGCEDFDYRGCLMIEVDGKKMFSFLDGEPEDANLGRDFSDVYGIAAAMELAYNAGVKGEGFSIEDIEVDDIEEIW